MRSTGDDTYHSAAELQRRFSISRNSLLAWQKEGKVSVVHTAGGHRRYRISDILAPSGGAKRVRLVYCRVSSAKQKADLQRQKDYMQQKYPEHEVISDIGSGINFKRRAFRNMVERVLRSEVEEVVVSHRDRLCRMAYDFLQWLFQKYGTSLVVEDREIASAERELADDLLSVVHVFSCRRYGIRRYRRSGRSGRRRDDDAVPADQDLPQRGADQDPPEMVQGQPQHIQPRCGPHTEADSADQQMDRAE